MNQEDIQKKQKKVMLYVMMLSLVLVIGVSYAFFTAGMSSETTTTVRADAGTMKITYAGGNNINLSGIYPREEVWATKTITVTGNNTTNAEMYYKLTLVIDSNTFSTSDPLQYELTSTNTSSNGNIIASKSKTNITGSSIELGSGNFVKANNAKHTYQLKIYYPKKTTSQNSNQGATFNAHVEMASTKAPSNELITFTLEGTKYQAKSGMTFEEWRDSEYNTFGYYFTESSTSIAKTVIESNKSYVLENNNTKIAGYIVSNLNETNFEFKKQAQILYHLAVNDIDFFANVAENDNDLSDDERENYWEIYDRLEGTKSLTPIPLSIQEDEENSDLVVKTEDGKYKITMTNQYLTSATTGLKILCFNTKANLFELTDASEIDSGNHTLTFVLDDISDFIIICDA